MNEIYRLRPVIDKTIEELTEPYLWFSRPTAVSYTHLTLPTTERV